MGLTLTILTPPNAAVVIHDGNRQPIPDGISPGWEPKLQWLVQSEPGIGATQQFLAARFNLLKTWQFTTTRTFNNTGAGYMACSDFISQLDTTIPPSGELQLLWRYGGAQWLRFVKQVFIESITPHNRGITAEIQYSLRFTAPYTSTP